MATARRRKGDLGQSDEAALLKLWNESLGHSLIQCAQYFANARMPSDVFMTEVDCAGFTLSYLEPNADTGVKDRLEMRIQFSETVDPSQIAAKLTEMAGEAKAVLSLKPNKNYTPPGRDKPTLLKYPSLLSWISMLLVWSAFMSLAFLPEVIYPLAVFRQAIGGMGASQNLVLGGVLIHAAEALAAVGFGVWAELPIEITFQYWFLIHFFGFAMLGPMIKMCLKRHEELEAKQEIRIQ